MVTLVDIHGNEFAAKTKFSELDSLCIKQWSRLMTEQAKRQSYFSSFIRPDIVDEFGHSIYDRYPRIGDIKT